MDINQDIIVINIKNKTQYAKPYYASEKTVTNITTDMTQFPYQRWYRGNTISHLPVIMEREAGYVVVQQNQKPVKEKSTYPNHVFTTACSTVFPSYPKDEADKKQKASQHCIDKFP